MSHRIVRVALTETRNAYPHMPEKVSDLSTMAARLDEIRVANVEHHVELIADAKRHGARIVGMGELFTGPYFALHCDPLWRGLAEDAHTGPTVTRMREVARDQSMILVAPIYERDAKTGRSFNTAVVIDEHGDILGKYRKAHIPVGENEQGGFSETYYYDASDADVGDGKGNVSEHVAFPVFETSVGRIGVAICYDRHFPRVMEALAHHGAELVFSPAVTFGEKSRRMWDLEFPVDAARYNIFIGGSNRRGKEPPWNQHYFGESYFVGPNGRVPRVESRPELVIADIDLGELGRPDPSGWNLPRDLRPEIYGKPITVSREGEGKTFK